MSRPEPLPALVGHFGEIDVPVTVMPGDGQTVTLVVGPVPGVYPVVHISLPVSVLADDAMRDWHSCVQAVAVAGIGGVCERISVVVDSPEDGATWGCHSFGCDRCLMQMLLGGDTVRSLAHRLHVSERSLYRRAKHIYRQLGVESRTAARSVDSAAIDALERQCTRASAGGDPRGCGQATAGSVSRLRDRAASRARP